MTGRALLLERTTRPLYAILLAAAVWILLRGHNAPGGGFIAGLVAVAGTAAYAMVFGATAAQRRLPFGPIPLALLGALLALVSGLPALALDRPYLMHLWWNLPLGFAELPLSTVLLFDAGVFLAVWGTLAGYVLALLRSGEPDFGETL